ncbi:hypothetical protein [Arcobacter caeni]|uniref:Uncharacterized protein n=1 Tax=Arcobacter caeni TaxID=1912877 RepID=A0A363CXI2_9BACT|nr:hypothetical protein [Arcobacter caeni]PUE63752.1 hypothetical protein B0174_09395 [Arcobacter caeni]
MVERNKMYLFLVALTCIVFYFFSNIKNINEGSSGLLFLGAFLLLGSFFIIYELFSSKRMFFRKSFIFLIVFVSYFVYRIVVDMENFYFLKVFTIGTTGGIVLFYFLGAIVSFHLVIIKNAVLQKKDNLKIFNIFFFLFSFFFLLIFLNSYYVLSASLSQNLFLITTLNGNYQRPGTFLTISFLMYSPLYILFLVLNNKYKNEHKVLIVVMTIVYLISNIGSILLSQMIASNNATVTLMGMLFLTLVFIVYIHYFKIDRFILNNKIILRNIVFNKNALLLMISIGIVVVLSIFTFIGTISIFDMNLSRFRIFGFGAQELSSVSSRIELWKNFSTHFNYSPIFGNMAVDRLTTGDGTYVHSFVGSLLTHLGVVGFSLFFIYLYFAIKEFFDIKQNFIENKIIKLYLFCLFLGIFAIAIAGVHLSWIPLWFLLGLIFPTFILQDKKKKI